jgi:hypothetical protein
MIDIDPATKRNIALADKYARTKDYICLFPGCKLLIPDEVGH